MSRDFASLAGDLGLEFRPAPFSVGSRDDIGFIFAASRVMDYETASVPEGVGDDDETQIEQVIRGWESLDPQSFEDTYQDFANEEFLVIGAEEICGVKSSNLKNKKAFAEELASSKVHCPRQTTVTNVQTVHIGGHRASSTYTIDENLTDGTSHHGNACAILVRLDVGWRIVIATGHLRG